MSSITYRPDIDGLRALSVLSVLLFHYGVGSVHGGFAGVDVFFVISGYLITSIIAGEIERGGFTFLGFYHRRVRRILPAALVVILVTLAAGWFVLLPTGFKALGESAAYSAAGLANFYFLWNTGYFDASAELQPMLHMWSLAVEEQFYIAWPLVLLLAMRLSGGSRKVVAGVLAAIIVGSFAASAGILAHGDPKIAFYMIHSRAWELALGGLLVFLPRIPGRVSGELLGVAGLALVVGSFFLLDADSVFPGINAAYPVVGAALLVWPRERRTWVARLLSLPPMVFIGKISFSLYLVHWPLLVLYRLYGVGEMPDTRVALVLMLASVLLAVMSWRFVEQPFRRRGERKVATVAAGAIAMAAVAATGVAIAASGGVPTRLPPELRKLEHYAAETVDSQNGFNGCFITSKHRRGPADFAEESCVDVRPGRRNVLLLGDSHAAHYAKALRDLYPEIGFSQVTVSGCRPVLRMPGEQGTCAILMGRAWRKYIPTGNFDAVILAGRWDKEHAYRLPRTITEIAPRVREVVVLGPVAEYSVELPVLLAKSTLRRDGGAIIDAARRYGSAAEVGEIVEQQVRPLGASYYSVVDALCNEGVCATTTAGGVPLQFDKAHLTYEGARMVVERLKTQGLLGGAGPQAAAP